MPTGREAKKHRTRARIVRAAYRLFARNGVAATSTARIARAARVSHGAIFLHFPTRGELVAQVIAECAQRMTRRVHELAEEGAGVRDVLAAHLSGLAEHEEIYARLVAEGPVLPPYARNTMLGIQAAISHHLARAAESEMERGTLRRMPLHLLFNTWLGLVHYYLVNRDLFAPGGSVLSAHGQELLDHYVRLMSP